ncbi:hypothetical protein ACIA6T_32015 [Streptomyces sp. NPDC051740]|uniref:hypothetical protein n=1 Tax=Streptomyces sp. NPDC051740 TaxID=3365673 RepID=UPI0037A99BBF
MPHDLRATWLRYIDSPGTEVELTGMSWRFPQTPWVTLEAGFTSLIGAVLEPAL